MPTNASQMMMPSVPITEMNASQLLAPIVAPAVVAFARAPATGAPLTATAVLAPGTVAIITPPSFSNASLPGELPPSPLLTSAVRPYLGTILREQSSYWTSLLSNDFHVVSQGYRASCTVTIRSSWVGEARHPIVLCRVQTSQSLSDSHCSSCIAQRLMLLSPVQHNSRDTASTS